MAVKLKLNKSAIQNLLDIAGEFTEDVAEELVVEAKGLAPVDSGDLRDSIKKRQVEDSDDDVWEVYSDESYAKIIEFGSRNQPAQPFMRPAISNVRSKH